ncbi:Alpha-1,3-mannosyl-glycoprotein 4-beta-N-acetylglucosaminyltransferase B, partial [Xenoophorus captivus]
DVVDIYQREFLALRERLHSAEQENLRRSKELNLVLEEIKRAIAEKQALRDINRTWSSLSGQCDDEEDSPKLTRENFCSNRFYLNVHLLPIRKNKYVGIMLQG